ncbi:MmoB/DmpM family protein [Bordetella holmesii]|uniref:MmoB/DmpM family protein n=1 Tax=Bordetella holmesii TaxID=35814 RepID=UPI000C76ACF1|nr:MmoB/DmpM family protein [Bordetella holmesii]AUL24796.1 monooxygenase [Bordetella holmesii]
MKNPVGPVLRVSDETDKIVAAIEDDNPDREIEIIDRGAYLRVQAEDRLVLTESSLQNYLGSDYRIRSLEAVLSSFFGRVATENDSITWYSGAAARTNGDARQGDKQ